MVKRKIISIFMILVGGLLLIGSAGALIASCTTDDNGNGVRDCFEGITPKPPTPTIVPIPPTPTGGPVPTYAPGTVGVSGALDLNNDGDYNDIGEKAPDSGAGIVIAITSLSMDTLYNDDHRLNSKIFLLKPGQSYKEYVTLDVRGGSIGPENNICVNYKLLRGSLVGPVHKYGDSAVASTPVCFDGLGLGEQSLVIDGRVPDWEPSHDWHLGNVKITFNGEDIKNGQFSNPRLDKPDRPRWMTKKYENSWCSIKTELLDGCVGHIIGTDSTTLKFKVALGHFLENPSRVQIVQLTYAGKWRTVYDGKPTQVDDTNTLAAMATGAVAGTIIPGAGTIGGALAGLAIDIAGVLDNTYLVSVPLSNFATMDPNGGYLKVAIWDENGNVIDLNTASDDTYARLNVDKAIVGGQNWQSDIEYFNMLGILKGFSVVGEEHPESAYFK